MESKALEPTPGQIQSIQNSPKLQEKVSRVHCGYCDAERSGLDEALKHINAQFRVLNIPLEKISQCGSFLVRAGGSGYVFQTRWFLWGGGGLGTGTRKGCTGVWGSVRGVISNNINQTQCLYFASETARVCSKSLGHGTLIPNLQRETSNSSPAW